MSTPTKWRSPSVIAGGSIAGAGALQVAWLWMELVAEVALTAPREHIEMLKHDLRYGLRTLAQNPAFTAVAVATLALGIGANTAIFSLLDAMVIHPLAFPEADRLVQIWEGDRQRGVTNWESNAPDFLDWRAQSRGFEQIAGYQHASFSLTESGDPDQVMGARVTANFFETLGVRPVLGRLAFTAAEDRAGGAPAAIVSEGLWRTRFQSDPDFIGKTISLDGLPRTVVGVTPKSFAFPHLGPATTMVPMAFTSRELQSRRMHWLYVIGKLRPGVTLRAAQAEMDGVAARLKAANPETNRDSGIMVVTLREQVAGLYSGAFWAIFGAVGFVLLIACANIANLLLARSSARQREIGVRMVMGVSRPRIVRQLLTESLLLFSIGGVAGVLAGVWGLKLLVSLVPVQMIDYLPHGAGLRINPLALGFTAGITVLTAIVFGLAPALAASSQDLNRATREGGPRGAGGRSGRTLRGLMVVAEVALALVLSIGAALLAKTFTTLQTMNHGFQPDHVVTVELQLPPARYPTGVQVAALYKDLLDRTRALPGVTAAGYVDFIPFLGANTGDGFVIEGKPLPPDGPPGARLRVASGGYFDAMRIPLLNGRLFGPGDEFDANKVVLISQALAKRQLARESDWSPPPPAQPARHVA